ncbi:MAG TPA: hypothetical protein VMI75_03935 [Polyangiaceae bacterium]|nr:hypothetical protein [Polyangiaceae bacterium]
MAPTRAAASAGETTVCGYCRAPLRWEPAESPSRDDQNWRRWVEEADADADPDVVPIGFGPLAIHALSRAQIQVLPQLPCKPTHLYVPPELAGGFSIADLRIGTRSQLASPNPIAASWFSSGRGSPIACDVAHVAVFIALLVENKTTEDRTFEAVLRCKRADPFSY